MRKSVKIFVGSWIGLTVLSILPTIVFALLKTFKIINWNVVWITSPLWIGFGLGIMGFIIIVAIIFGKILDDPDSMV